MNPQRSLLTKRSIGAYRSGQFNRRSDLLHRQDRLNKNMTEKNFGVGLDITDDIRYTRTLTK